MQDDWSSSSEIHDDDDICSSSKNPSSDSKVSPEQGKHTKVVVFNTADNLNEPQEINEKSPKTDKNN